jgi:cell division protein FtsB
MKELMEKNINVVLQLLVVALLTWIGQSMLMVRESIVRLEARAEFNKVELQGLHKELDELKARVADLAQRKK